MKKTEFITLRTTKEVKEALVKIGSEKKWSVSLLSEEIISEWLKKQGYIKEEE